MSNGEENRDIKNLKKHNGWKKYIMNVGIKNDIFLQLVDF